MRIVGLTVIFAVAFPLNRLRGSDSGPELLAWYFQTCGGAFIKFGQLLATRYDLLTPPYTRALANLLDNLPAAPYETVVKIIEADLGRPLETCFIDFERRPIGSASIAQVHRARLLTGERIVIKIKHLESERIFQTDAVILRFISQLLQLTGLLSSIPIGVLTEQVIQFTSTEYDFRQEARNIQMFHDLLLDDEINHYAPEVYDQYCGDSIIVMEYLHGVWLYELLDAVEVNDTEQLAIWGATGIYPSQVAHNLLNSIITQCYRHRVFHADPHAANIVVMRDSKIGYIDFGLIGWIDERYTGQDFQLYQNMIQENFHAAYQNLLNLLQPVGNIDLNAFELEAKELLRNWVWNARHPRMPAEKRSIATLLLSLLNLLRRYHLRFPLSTIRLYRSMIIADLILLKLYPDYDRFTALEHFIRDEVHYSQRRYVASVIEPEQILQTLIESLNSLQNGLQIASTLQYTLPAVLQSYVSRSNPIHLFSQIGRRIVYSITLLGMLFILGGKLIAPVIAPDGTWYHLIASLGSDWWIMMVFGVLIMLLTGSSDQ
ncbi:MAG TPA: AarF/ABC1/UbiB kinase family protein [Phototrophicaceae bacterium]|nr:AarF/ABC1/UbiB kinase family protein [Phototrophicaceae bacterium]